MVFVLKKLKGLSLGLENLQGLGLGLAGDGLNYITASFRLHDQNYERAWFFLIFLLIYRAVVIKFIAAPGSVLASH